MEEFHLVKLVMLMAVGVIAGFINTLAGGGSFLTVPVLIFMGMPPTTANATNRLAVFLQSLTAVARFRTYGVFPLKFSLIVTIPAVLGSVFGAWLAMVISEEAFKNYLAAFMVVMTLATFLRPGKMLEKREIDYTFGRWVLIWLVFFGIGIYGGFLQAGVGFLVLAGLLLSGHDFVSGNAIKTFIILMFTLAALIIFIIGGMVEYLPGAVLGIGSMIGAAVGARTTVKKGNVFVQRFVVAMVIVFALLLLFR